MSSYEMQHAGVRVNAVLSTSNNQRLSYNGGRRVNSAVIKAMINAPPIPSWRSPEGPLNVWKIVDGFEKLQDGTSRPCKFSIQEIPNDRYEEVLDLMVKYFMADEPINRSLNFKNDSVGIKEFRSLWTYCLLQGVSVGAFKIDANGRILELAGANVLVMTTPEVEKELGKQIGKFRSPIIVKIFKMLHELDKNVDIPSIFGVDRYLGAIGLSVKPKFQGNKLGLHILEARSAIGRKYGVKVTKTLFTARSSQILAERAGFEDAFLQNTDELCNEDGSPYFPNIETKTFKIMIKKLC